MKLRVWIRVHCSRKQAKKNPQIQGKSHHRVRLIVQAFSTFTGAGLTHPTPLETGFYSILNYQSKLSIIIRFSYSDFLIFF